MMKRNLCLILIIASLCLIFFQNFEAPPRVLPIENHFESNETDPMRRLGAYAESQMTEQEKASLKNIESKLQIHWQPDVPQASDSEGARMPASDFPTASKNDRFTYGLANIRTLRISDDVDQLNCKVQSGGVNLVWQHHLSSTASYVLEHNTEEHKSQAKIQWTW